MNTTFERAWLDRQADQIEAALSTLSLAVRVNGGEIAGDRVRYHATPLAGTRPGQVQAAARAVASALGADRIQVAEEADGISIDVQIPEKGDLRLLPLVHALGELSQLTAVIGMTESGNPLVVNLRNPHTWHALITGPTGSGKSELLRTLAISIALTSRESQLQLIGFDLGGRDLAVIEALPHGLTDLANDAVFAQELASWLVTETTRRRQAGIQRPDLVVLVDDLSFALTASDPKLWEAFSIVLREGKSAGIHLLAAAPVESLPPKLDKGLASGVLRAVAAPSSKPGVFDFQVDGEQFRGRVAWLSARDLDTAIRLLEAGWRTRLNLASSGNGEPA